MIGSGTGRSRDVMDRGGGEEARRRAGLRDLPRERGGGRALRGGDRERSLFVNRSGESRRNED